MEADNVAIFRLAEMIHGHCGIDYRKNLPCLQSKVAERLEETGLSLWEYCGYLTAEPKEWDALIELVTVNETYFFREENLLDEFKNEILPLYADRTPENPLRIWSSACSTGEEPYTVAMLVEESGLFRKGSVRIVATDINKKVLNKAKSGLYKKKSFSFRRTPAYAYSRFFIEHEDEYKIKDSIREMVEFRCMNLLDGEISKKMEKMDVIFCRNVLIYFDAGATQKAIEAFHEILNPVGYLFLGHAETISGRHPGFYTVHTPSTFYFRKGEGDVAAARRACG